MSEIVAEKLVQLISRYGQNLVDEEVRTRGLLKDVCGELHKKEVIALVSVIQEGIAKDLLVRQNSGLIYARMARGSERLQDHRGFTEELATWSVETWAVALGVVTSIDLIDYKASISNSSDGHVPLTPENPQPTPEVLSSQSEMFENRGNSSAPQAVVMSVVPAHQGAAAISIANSNISSAPNSGTKSRRLWGGYFGIAGVLLVALAGFFSYPKLLSIYGSITNKSSNTGQSSSSDSQLQPLANGITCEGAASAQDKTVCLNPILLAKSKALTVSYEGYISGLSQIALDTVNAGQIAWKAYWPRVCSKDAAKVFLTKDSFECIVEEFDKRSNELSVAKMVSGFRVYQVDLYEIRTSDADDTYGPAKHSLRFPQFDIGNSQVEGNTQLSSLNRWLRHDSKKWLQSLDNLGDSIDSSSVKEVTKDILQSSHYVYFYGHGAAHESSTLGSNYYLVNEGRVLLANDIFQGTTWVQVVADFAYDALSKSLGADSLTANRSEFDLLVQDISGWEFTKEGFVLNFNAYQVVPYAAGPQSTTIPWTLLNQHLTPFAKGQIERFPK